MKAVLALSLTAEIALGFLNMWFYTMQKRWYFLVVAGASALGAAFIAWMVWMLASEHLLG